MSFKGYKHSEETKKKISQSETGKIISAETRKKISEIQIGRKLKESTKRKISKKLSLVMIGNNHGLGHKISPEHRVKLNKSIRERIISDQERQEISRKSILQWERLSDEKKIEKLSAMQKGLHKAKPSSIEIAIAKVLDEINEPYEQNKYMFKYYPDFYLPNRNMVIECNGDYWHNLPHRIERDIRFEKACKERNIKIIFLWERDIRANPQLTLLENLNNYQEATA